MSEIEPTHRRDRARSERASGRPAPATPRKASPTPTATFGKLLASNAARCAPEAHVEDALGRPTAPADAPSRLDATSADRLHERAEGERARSSDSQPPRTASRGPAARKPSRSARDTVAELAEPGQDVRALASGRAALGTRVPEGPAARSLAEAVERVMLLTDALGHKQLAIQLETAGCAGAELRVVALGERRIALRLSRRRAGPDDSAALGELAELVRRLEARGLCVVEVTEAREFEEPRS